MAVIEYMLLRDNGSHQRFTPGFVGDRGHLLNSIDNSLIGWVQDVRDFYVPDSIVTLTKEKLIERQLAIHAVHPFQKPTNEESESTTDMTIEEVTTHFGEWYDWFVFKNTTDGVEQNAAPYLKGPSNTI